MNINLAKPFVAIDFETANHSPASACAVAAVRVEKGEIVARWRTLIRPPTREFVFTSIHGLTWRSVAGSDDFAAVWPALRGMMAGVSFVAAHNARFDQGVLDACCAHHRIQRPAVRFVCTVELARATWRLPRHRLPDVCRHLGIPLDHHDALSDAEACARIVLAAASVRTSG